MHRPYPSSFSAAGPSAIAMPLHTPPACLTSIWPLDGCATSIAPCPVDAWLWKQDLSMALNYRGCSRWWHDISAVRVQDVVVLTLTVEQFEGKYTAATWAVEVDPDNPSFNVCAFRKSKHVAKATQLTAYVAPPLHFVTRATVMQLDEIDTVNQSFMVTCSLR